VDPGQGEAEAEGHVNSDRVAEKEGERKHAGTVRAEQGLLAVSDSDIDAVFSIYTHASSSSSQVGNNNDGSDSGLDYALWLDLIGLVPTDQELLVALRYSTAHRATESCRRYTLFYSLFYAK